MGEASAEKERWTTGEELLLACAVKRHGCNNWDSVAMELQIRSSLSSLLTPNHCRQKYTDLQRRFNQDQDLDLTESDIPWLDQLRQHRVAELREEVLRYDVSILSLQSKVKRLKEDRQEGLKGNQNNGDQEPDLKDLEPEAALKTPESALNSVSDRDNQSFNESNSTGRRGDNGHNKASSEDAEKEPETPKIQPDLPADRPNQADENSYNTEAKKNESSSAEGEEVKESSEVQSSASLTGKKQRTLPDKRLGGAISSGEEPVIDDFCGGADGGTVQAVFSGSEALVSLLRKVASHKQSSLFGARLFRSQDDTEAYRRWRLIIRQHLDLDAVQARLRQGSYGCFTRMFLRDLLLLFTNFIVCSPRASPESIAAHELRCLVCHQLKNQIPPLLPGDNDSPPPPPELERPNSLLAKQKSPAPIVVCRKRSSLTSAKTPTVSALPSKAELLRGDDKPAASLELRPLSNSTSSLWLDEEEQNNLGIKERVTTGARSSRCSKHLPAKNNITTATKQSRISPKLDRADNAAGHKSPEMERVKRTRKKTMDSTRGKKRGAADFLKRIKLNTTPLPMKGTRNDESSFVREPKTRGQTSGKLDNEKGGGGSVQVRGGKQAKEDDSNSKRSVGRPPKKGADSTTPPKRKVAEKEAVASNRRRKRSRR